MNNQLSPDLTAIVINSSGTGTFQLGTAALGHFGIESLIDGATYSYTVIQNNNAEVGKGVYFASTQTMTRSVLRSSYGNQPVPFSAGAVCNFAFIEEDFAALQTQLNAGASAYGTWLTLPGNAGKTQAQFIASLTGATGATGAQGAQGNPGAAGPAYGGYYPYTAPPAVPSGVPSGQGYWMLGAASGYPPLVFCINNGGAGSIIQGVVFAPQHSTIFCKTISDNGNSVVIQVPFAGISVPADLSNVRFKWKAGADKAVGGFYVQVNDYYGNALLNVQVYNKHDATDANLELAGYYHKDDTLEIARSTVTYHWMLESYADTITPQLAPVYQDEIFPRELISVGRTVACNKISNYNYKVRVKLNGGTMYKGAQRAREGDEAVFIFRNLAPDQGINTAFDLNSITGHFKQTEHQIANFMFDHLAANLSTDTGLVSSTFSTVVTLCKAGGTPTLSGRNHGLQGNGTGTLIGTQNDPGQGTVTSGDLSGLPIGPIWKGVKLLASTSNTMLFPDMTVAGTNSMNLAFESGTDHLYAMDATLDFTSATATPYVGSGYCQMAPMRDIDTLVPIYGYGTGTQAAGTPVTGCDARDGVQVNFPVDSMGRYPDAVSCFNSDNPLVKLIVACGFPSGYAYAINGTPVARDATSPVFFIRNQYGPKLYFAFAFNASPISVAGQVWTFKARYYVLISDPTIYI